MTFYLLTEIGKLFVYYIYIDEAPYMASKAQSSKQSLSNGFSNPS